MRFPSMSIISRRLAQLMCLLVLTGICASSAVITFGGEDLNAGPGGPFTNSNAAATSFKSAASALGSIGLITFESAPLGAFTSLPVASGVTASGPSGLSINNVPNFPSAPAVDGFNTTPGGAQYIEDQAGTLTITFATPVQFFGAYLTGLQALFAQDTITFNDGTTQTINALETGTSGSVGAVNFLGFTDAGKLISSVTITSTNGGSTDYIGVDDVMYQTGVPEPASMTLVLAAFLGFVFIWQVKRRSLNTIIRRRSLPDSDLV